MVVTLQELKAMSAVNSRTLELVQKLNRQQVCVFILFCRTASEKSDDLPALLLRATV